MIKPCPCCGSEAKLHLNHGNFESAWVTIVCTKCQIQTSKYYYEMWAPDTTLPLAKENAIEVWNKRI